MTARVPTMHLDARLPYAEGPGWKAVSLGYQGSDLSMLVIVPDAGTFEAFERDLTAERFEAIVAAPRDHMTTLSLPRFSFRAQASLVPALSAMGMAQEFRAGSADFSGIDGTKDLVVTAVVHEGFVDVGEEGTEAAAATGVAIGIRSAAPSREEPLVVRADRPFAWAIIERPTGTILFAGAVRDPRP